MLQLHTAYAALMEARMKVKDLIALLQKEDPEAVVIKYNDGGTTATSSVEALLRVPIRLPQGMQDQAAILIE
jgi:hypothetical protein